MCVRKQQHLKEGKKEREGKNREEGEGKKRKEKKRKGKEGEGKGREGKGGEGIVMRPPYLFKGERLACENSALDLHVFPAKLRKHDGNVVRPCQRDAFHQGPPPLTG